MARLTGWIAVALLVLAASWPLVYRLRLSRRATLQSPTIRFHVVLGLTTASFAFTHTIVSLLSLGSPDAIGAGALPLFSAGAAFFLLIAHSGLGLQLREPTLRERAQKRRMHTMTAIAIAITVAVHVGALLTAE